MELEFTYKNGKTFTNTVHYVHADEEMLYYIPKNIYYDPKHQNLVKKNPAPVVQTIVCIPFNDIVSFNVIIKEEEVSG